MPVQTRTNRMLAALLTVSTILGFASIGEAFDRLGRWFEGSKERLVVFPTYARLHDDGDLSIPLRAWVYEPEEDSSARDLLVASLQEILEIEGDEERERFERRIRPFLFDNERGERVRMRLGDETFEIGTTTPDGHVSRRVRIPRKVAARTVRAVEGRRWLEATFEMESVSLERRIPLVERRGRTVVSDIDDTLKVTEVLDRTEMLRNTFLREFEAVDGMAPLLRALSRGPRTRVHYLSASPWQLFAFLEPFLRESGFPEGLFHLRQLRPKSISSPIDFAIGSSAYKRDTIEQLLEDFPNRSFVLVGDSGEHDPEVYGEVARAHPEQVERILIRRVPEADHTDTRFQRAFDGIPESTWTLFEDPSTVDTPEPDTEDDP